MFWDEVAVLLRQQGSAHLGTVREALLEVAETATTAAQLSPSDAK
jgi:hypothetical protein